MTQVNITIYVYENDFPSFMRMGNYIGKQCSVIFCFEEFQFFCGSFVLFMSCVSHAFTSVHCCLVVTCCERAGLLALVGDLYCFYCVTFPCGALGRVWCLIVTFPDFCHLSYFVNLISMETAIRRIHFLC